MSTADAWQDVTVVGDRYEVHLRYVDGQREFRHRRLHLWSDLYSVQVDHRTTMSLKPPAREDWVYRRPPTGPFGEDKVAA